MSLENKYFAELARRLRAAGITAGHPEKNRLTVLLNNQPVLSVSAGSDVFLLPAGSNQPEAGELYHKVAQTADEVYAYLEGDGLTADPMFRREALERWLERKNLPVRWVDGVYDRLANGESIQNAQPLKSLRIWQLKPDTPIEMRFIGLDRMAREFDGPNPSQYRIAYDGQAESQELEDIWNKFCRRTLPGGDHPLAISDVIELYDVDGSAFYYVDKREIVSVDFTPVIHENMNTPEPSRKDGSDQRLFQKLEQEYLAYLEPLRSAALSELLEKAGEIADTQAVYRCLCENTGLSTEQKEKLATLEQPLQAIRDRWRQTHPTPEPELLEACEALTTSQQQSEETPALSMTL